MSSQTNQNQKTPQVVYIVACYQTIIGVYVSQEDALACQLDLINRNRPADVLCRTIIEPVNKL